jgi:hypothetical protein
MGLFSTLATFVGGTVPPERRLDGVNQSAF